MNQKNSPKKQQSPQIAGFVVFLIEYGTKSKLI